MKAFWQAVETMASEDHLPHSDAGSVSPVIGACDIVKVITLWIKRLMARQIDILDVIK